MNKPSPILWSLCAVLPALFAAAEPLPSAQAPSATQTPSTPTTTPPVITALNGNDPAAPIGLNETLWVQLANAGAPNATIDASRYVLFFNGLEVQGLPDPTYRKDVHSIGFELKRNDKNRDLWTSLLGAPSFAHPSVVVDVALGEKPTDKTAVKPTITGTNSADLLHLKVFGPYSLAIATLLIASVILLVVARARSSTTLRDSYLPQIEPSQQTYSLARCQMAFWFVLIFCSFIFLYIATGDYNTVSQQALVLMGISGATALAAVEVDANKDSPADAVNRGLRALGINSYDDVGRMEADITAKTQELNSHPAPTPQRITQLTLEINDLRNRLATYRANIRPFTTQGFFKDVITDINGTAIHRLQVFCWTLILGGVFIIGVYRDLAMPEFGGTLLALMGISSAGYVGFKIPEKNN
jgi:hypothetical protein